MSAIKASAGLGITGEYRFITHGGARGTIDHGTSKNMILDSGIDALLGLGRSGPDRCWVGTSNAAVASTQTDLQGTKVLMSAVQSTLSSLYVAGPPPYVECTRTYRFNTGVATGTWAEVGTGWNDGTGQARFSRALILPSTVTVLADEQLDVVFTVRFYPSTTDVTGTVTLEGTPTDYTARFACWNSGSTGNFFWITAPMVLTGSIYASSNTANLDLIGATGITLGSSGTNNGSDGSTMAFQGSYTAGSFTRTVRVTWPLNAANVGGVRKIAAAVPNVGNFGLQAVFTPVINKTNTKVLTLDFAISITRRP